MNTKLQNTHPNYAYIQSVVSVQGIKAFLPEHISPDSFMRTAATALIQNPGLMTVDKDSFLLALTRCAKDGLMPDGREAALVVLGKKVVYMPMVDGVIKRARQSGQVSSIFVDIVYDADEFKRWTDERGTHFKHIPNDTEERGKIRLVYAAAKLKNDEFLMEVMSRSDVEKVRDTMKKGKSEAWVQWFDRMALKTVIHRLARRLPCASELFSMFEVYKSTNSTEKPLKTASASFKRLSLTDVIHERKEKLRQKPETVTASPPETQPLTNPKLEAALIALDDVTDEKSLAEIVEHCTVLSAELSEDEKIQLREKIKASKKRLIPAKKESEVWMARLANGTGDAWRFRDGEIVHGFFEAEKKTKEMGAVLEERKKYRFSPGH